MPNGDFWSGFTTQLAPQISNLALQFHGESRQKEAAQHQYDISVLEHLAKADDPEIADRAVAGLIKKSREMETGKSAGGKKGGVLAQIFSPEFAQDEDMVRLRGTMDMVKQAYQAGGAGTQAPKPMGGPTPSPAPSSPPPGNTMPPGFDPSSIPENIRAPELDPAAAGAPPAAQLLGGSLNLQPGAAVPLGGGATGAPPLAPDQGFQPSSSSAVPLGGKKPVSSVQEEVAGLGYRPNALGGYGEGGQKALSSVLQGRTTEKSRAANETALRRAQMVADSHSSEGQANRTAAKERVLMRLDGQMERLHEAEKLRGKRPKSGSKSGINFEKESVEASQHYSSAINQLESQKRQAMVKLQLEATEKDWDPATLSQQLQLVESDFTQQRSAVDQGYQKNIALIGRLAGGKAPAGVEGAGGSTAPPIVGGSAPPPGAGTTPPPQVVGGAAGGAAGAGTRTPAITDFPPNAPLGSKHKIGGTLYERVARGGQLGWARAAQ